MFRLAMPVVGLLIALAVPAVASAGQPVDPSTLTPEPPPGAECRATANGVICDTVFDDSILTPVPVADLPCGTLYETKSDLRNGVRWHDAQGRLLERQVTQQLRGSWSLSADMSGPTASISAHANWRDRLAVPGDFETAATTFHGVQFKVSARGHGNIFIEAGHVRPDGSQAGHFDEFDDATIAEFCDALID